MPTVRITLLQSHPTDFVRRIGAAVYRAPAERLTRELGICCEDDLVSLVEGKEENRSLGPGIARYAE